MQSFGIDRSRYDHSDEEKLTYKAKPGLSEELVREISRSKNEPDWMLAKRLEGLRAFKEMSFPSWGPDLSSLDISKIHLFMRPDAKKNASDWNEVPKDIRETYDRLGILEAEKKALSGVGAQYESEAVYHNLKEKWAKQGVIFLDCDEAVQKHPGLVKKYFMTSCVPIRLHKFAALHVAVWSGGTFIYIPKGVKVDIPLQAYFRMNAKRGGQFEHTVIVIDEGAEMHYIEGCSAPQYSENSMHAGCVEIHVLKGARARYSSIENWSKNTYNLNTKRAVVYEDGVMEWVNGNMGSRTTMLYPCSVLMGARSKSHYLGIAYAGEGQHQDTGSKVYHIGKNTSSTIVSKSLSKDGGITSYRGLVSIRKGAISAASSINCDTLMMDEVSKSNTYPTMKVDEKSATVAHEATVGRISDEQLFYLMSRGISKDDATRMIVSGFIEPIVKELPLEYAVELNRLIEIEMEGSLG
ncbi:Fe-S cluster assembly protein SufB [Candidatus Woesearchaeota archaeon]|nr:Fe-S cluster assembly protein SufB [Candidatus Woesearchaeota archaeon]